MKKLILATLMLATTGALFTGCKKSDSTPKSSMSATIGGTTWTADVATGSTSSGSIGVLGSKLNGNTPTSTISIDIAGASTAGTYNLDSTGNVTIVYSPDGSTEKFAITGTVTFSSVTSTSAKGTFSCMLTDSTMITNGTFDAHN